MRRGYKQRYVRTPAQARGVRRTHGRPYVQGRDLLEHGVEPGPLMGETLQYAHKLRLAGMTKEHQLRQSLGYYRAIARKQERAQLHDK